MEETLDLKAARRDDSEEKGEGDRQSFGSEAWKEVRRVRGGPKKKKKTDADSFSIKLQYYPYSYSLITILDFNFRKAQSCRDRTSSPYPLMFSDGLFFTQWT